MQSRSVRRILFRTLQRYIKKWLFAVCGSQVPYDVPILLYHAIDNSGSVISVFPELFREHMAFLKEHGYQTTTFKNYFLEREKAVNSSRQKQVIITFDDGLGSVYQNAFPILKEFSFSAVVFVVTNLVGAKAEWFNRDRNLIVSRLLSKLNFSEDERNTEEERMKMFSDESLLTWAEIREMDSYGLEFQSHGHSHSFLSLASAEELEHEVKTSKRILEKELKCKINWFCYPYGDFDNAALFLALEKTGYEGAVKADWVPLNKAHPFSKFMVNRMPVSNYTDIFELSFLLSPGYGYYRKLVGILNRFRQ